MQHRKNFTHSIIQASRFIVLAFFVWFFACFTIACKSENFNTVAHSRNFERATVIKVLDGDSVILRFTDSSEKEARLFGIDAPEYNQPYGKEARRALEKLVLKKSVLVEKFGQDRYQREIILLKFDRKQGSVNLEMLKLGAAWVYSQYQDDEIWLNAHVYAKKQQKGLWNARHPVAPWVWRKK